LIDVFWLVYTVLVFGVFPAVMVAILAVENYGGKKESV
jgi:hypothetical protein